MRDMSQSTHNTISRYLNYASQVAGANVIWRNHQSSLDSCAADTLSAFQETA